MEFKKGDTCYTWRGCGKPYKTHIVEIVEGHMVVFKWYGRHKQRWHYEVKHASLLEVEVYGAKKNT